MEIGSLYNIEVNSLLYLPLLRMPWCGTIPVPSIVWKIGEAKQTFFEKSMNKHINSCPTELIFLTYDLASCRINFLFHPFKTFYRLFYSFIWHLQCLTENMLLTSLVLLIPNGMRMSWLM